MTDEERDLVRLADALGECAGRLARDLGDDDGPRTDDVRRLLQATAAELAHHAAAMRGLDDEMDLLRRRRQSAAEMRELTVRRDRAIARVTDHLDASTRSLVPGGDRLEPEVILRRLGITSPSLGWGGAQRMDRLGALTSFLRRGSFSRRPVAQHARGGPVVITVMPRRHRLARLHRRLRSARADHTSEVTA